MEVYLSDAEEYLSDLEKMTDNIMLKEIIREIKSGIPDFSYMDWADREEFYTNDYADILKGTIEGLEKIIKEM